MNELLNDNNKINKYGSITTQIQCKTIPYHHINNNDNDGIINAQQKLISNINKKKPKSSPRSPYLRAFRPASPAITCQSALPSPHVKSKVEDDVDDKINVWQAGFTVINLFLGLCLLSYPYAIQSGSLISIIPFIFICFALCYTGKLIVRCFNTLSNDIEHSYPMVGFYSFSNFGYFLISFGIIAELFGALCTNTIFLWTNLSFLLLPFGLSLDEIILIASLVSLPTCWMLNFNELTINSFLGCICKIFTAIVVFITFFYNLDNVKYNINNNNEIKIFPTSIQSFCISIGIYIMSFSGHPCLPGIYRAMKNPKKFEKMLDCCFIIMCICYILISIFGYLTFGKNTNIIITGNLLNQNIYLSKTLIILVIAGCYFQVSPLIAVMAEIPENNLFKLNQKTNSSKFKIRIFRTILFLFICFASYICMDKLALLEAITGSLCTMIVSVICPALFYHKLFLSKKSKLKKKIIINNNNNNNNDTSPIFVANGLSKQKLIIASDDNNNNNNNNNNLGLTIILYLYIIIGTIFGLYMFVTDLINALNKS